MIPEIKDAPKAPEIIIIEAPKYGTIEVKKDGTLIYTSTLEDKKSTVVDSVTYTYTNLSGKVVVVRQNFLLAQKGDVPRIIQTGPDTKGKCVPLKATGKTIGTIKVGNLSVPIKSFIYPAGGIMEPQRTTTAAGLSLRHMPLSSTLGNSVITWHVNYNGCWNPLNTLTGKKVGYKFSITDEKGGKRTYRIEKKYTVTKGSYKESWFTLIGPRQLTLVTCTGAFKNGHYEKNSVLIAVPVK